MKRVLPIVHFLLEAFCVNIRLAPHVLPERLEHRIIACGESHLKDTSLSRGESTGFGILHRDVLLAYLVHEELSALDEFLLDRIVAELSAPEFRHRRLREVSLGEVLRHSPAFLPAVLHARCLVVGEERALEASVADR